MFDKETNDMTNEELIESSLEIQKQLLLKTRQNAELERRIQKRKENFQKVEKMLQEKLQTINSEIQSIKKSQKRQH